MGVRIKDNWEEPVNFRRMFYGEWLGYNHKMKNKKPESVTATLFFLFWLAVLYAGADHPPPPGFIFLIIIDLMASILIFFRLGTYLAWQSNRRRLRLVQIPAEGLLAGLVIALVVILIPTKPEPGVSIRLIDRVIWFAVLGLVGMVNSMSVFIFGVFLSKLFNRKDSSHK